jgi:DNA-3-methyladenine glycosylase I
VQENYIHIFSATEQTLKTNSGLSDESFANRFSSFRNQTFRKRTDEEYFQILKCIVFYSGFRAETVTKKLDVINKHLPDYKTISLLDDSKLALALSDADMIKNPSKIYATVNNAKTFRDIVDHYGSFQSYVESFNPTTSFENLMLLKEELEYRFDYLGGVTVYHFLTDIGLDVVKPDRVLVRIFQRLGLIENEKQLLKTVIQGRKFSTTTGHPIRYIDIIFVTYGQQGKDGICFSKNPKCNLCGLTLNCNYYKSLNTTE